MISPYGHHGIPKQNGYALPEKCMMIPIFTYHYDNKYIYIIILYYIILYYTILYYITLYYIILYYIYTVRERNSHLYRIDGGLSPSPFVSPNGRRRRRPSRTSSPRSNAPTGGSGASSTSGNLGSSTPLSLTTRNEGPGTVGGDDGKKKKNWLELAIDLQVWWEAISILWKPMNRGVVHGSLPCECFETRRINLPFELEEVVAHGLGQRQNPWKMDPNIHPFHP